MDRRIRNITGERFNRLTAIKPTNKRSTGHVIWECECDCGSTKLVSGHHLLNGGIKSCGCLLEERKRPYGEASFNSLIIGYIRSAEKRNYSFEITESEFRNMTKQNCFYCGCEPHKEFKASGSNKFNGNYVYNGVDRKDNSKGYTRDNCVPCCWECNNMKKGKSKEEFINHCKSIAKEHSYGMVA